MGRDLTTSAIDRKKILSDYELFKCVRFRNLRQAFLQQIEQPNVSDIDVGDISQTSEDELLSLRPPGMGIFTFRSVLNIGMLLTESEGARQVRSAILNIVIDVVHATNTHDKIFEISGGSSGMID
jgi:hypothetical protein